MATHDDRHVAAAFRQIYEASVYPAGRHASRAAGPGAEAIVLQALEILGDGLVFAEDVACFLNGVRLHPRYYAEEGRAALTRLDELFLSGATIRLERLDRYFSELRRASAAVRAAGNGRSWFNMYISPIGSAGLGRHADDHPVVAIQLAGRKHWATWANEDPEGGGHGRNDGAPAFAGVLVPGEALYLPPGRPHAATTCSAVSVHVAWGLDEAACRRLPTDATTAAAGAAPPPPSLVQDPAAQTRSGCPAILSALRIARLGEDFAIRRRADRAGHPPGDRRTYEWHLEDGRIVTLQRPVLDALWRTIGDEWTDIAALRAHFDDDALLRILIVLVLAGMIELRAADILP